MIKRFKAALETVKANRPEIQPRYAAFLADNETRLHLPCKNTHRFQSWVVDRKEDFYRDAPDEIREKMSVWGLLSVNAVQDEFTAYIESGEWLKKYENSTNC